MRTILFCFVLNPFKDFLWRAWCMKHLPQHACLRFGFWMTNNSDIAVRLRLARTNL
jgi:hypothetical protein